MSSALREETWVSPEDYLEEELAGETRHEYVGGSMYAMSGSSEEHNVIALNIAAALRERLRGHPCRVYMNDLKVKLRVGAEDVFYYPDVFVVCDHTGGSTYFKERPAVIFEVLSPGTEQIDKREKLLAYQTIPSLETYVLVEQSRIGLTVFQRRDTWRATRLSSKEDKLRLGIIDYELSIGRIYEDTGL